MYNEFDNNENRNNQPNFTMGGDYIPPVSEPQEEKKKKKKSNFFARGVAYTCIFGLVAGTTFAGANYFLGDSGSNKISIQQPGNNESNESGSNASGNTILTTNAVQGATVTDVSNVADAVMPSVVSIHVTAEVTQNVWGQQYSQETQGSGSGIIIKETGSELLIVTNNHVVEGATSVKIAFVDGEIVDATVKGTDSSNDLAVVSVPLANVKDSTKEAIRIATLGDSDEAKVGEMVIAIGNALGYGQSVTVGYLSAKDREVQTEDYTMNLLQTDAAINPGNSGGALLNAAGQVIGINSVKYSSTEVEGIGYAIPISYAEPIINDLMNREVVPEDQQAYLGIKFGEVSAAYVERFNMPNGLYISETITGSPAAKGGLKAGDIIVKVDGRDMITNKAFSEYLSSKRAGTTIEITVKRLNDGEYKEKTISVTLGNKADYASTENSGSSNGNSNGNSNGSGSNPWFPNN